MATNKWIVVSDFDGTISQKDIGNELCKIAIPDKFTKLLKRYRSEDITLRDMQEEFWLGFPMDQETFTKNSLEFGAFRPGVNEFFESCTDKNIPIYIASCGMDAYINPVLDKNLSEKAKKSLCEVRSNQVLFDHQKISELITPLSDKSNPLPFHKGEWCCELAEIHQANVLAIGNGTSDRSFIGNVSKIAACDSFSDYLKATDHDHFQFTDFNDLLTLLNEL